MKPSTSSDLILASSSRYRQRLLSRLNTPFTIKPSAIDETPYPGEAPDVLAKRLAQTKAKTVAHNSAQAFIIGSDQVAVVDQSPLSKPGNYQQAFKQLQLIRGRIVFFHTALCLVAPDKSVQIDNVITQVTMAVLTDAELSQYLQIECPYDVVGGIKFESLGIALARKIETTDPSALIGLPLISLCNMLRQAGFPLLQS